MTTATATWTLTGITHTRGTCDHCGRTIARRFAQAEAAERRAHAEAAAAADFGPLWVEAVAQRDREAAVTGRAGAAGEAVTALRDRTVPGDLLGFVADCLAVSHSAVGAA